MYHPEIHVNSIVTLEIIFFKLLIPLRRALLVPHSVIYNSDCGFDNHRRTSHQCSYHAAVNMFLTPVLLLL